MRQLLYILLSVFLLASCSQNDSAKKGKNGDEILHEKSSLDTTSGYRLNQEIKRQRYSSISQVVNDSTYSTWVKLDGEAASLALHFMYNDTLAVSYSSECWLMYPYKIENDKIVVYWETIIDSKYNFDIVKAVNNTDKKLVGKPFMILELENDTTFKATYLLKNLIRKINSSSSERTFFPDRYMLVQDYH